MAQRKVTMTLEGVDALKAAVTRAPAVLKAHVGSAHHTTAFAISQRMRATAPDRTGTLKRSISVASRGLSSRVFIGPEAFYWRFVEYGTRHSAANPFIRASTESESNTHEQRIRAIGPLLERDFSSGRHL
jgi:HK97 gp10 family phage protein